MNNRTAALALLATTLAGCAHEPTQLRARPAPRTGSSASPRAAGSAPVSTLVYDRLRVRESPALRLPASSESAVLGGAYLRVVVSTGQITLETNTNVQRIATVKSGAVADAAKPGGEAASYLIEPLLRALKRHLARWPSGTKKALALVVDHTTPFRLVIEVLYTAGQAGVVGPTCLVTRAGGGTACVDIYSPSYAEPTAADKEPALNLTMAVIYKGFIVAGAGGVLVGDDGHMPTIKCKAALVDGRCPARPGAAGAGAWISQYDHTALLTLLKKIKRRYPGERQVNLSADHRIPLQVVVCTLDTLRGEPDGRLFDRAALIASVQ